MGLQKMRKVKETLLRGKISSRQTLTALDDKFDDDSFEYDMDGSSEEKRWLLHAALRVESRVLVTRKNSDVCLHPSPRVAQVWRRN